MRLPVLDDPVDPARSRQMARIRSKDTQPEMIVRRLSHHLGFRHRLHDARLPGKPDLVYPSRKAVIFVHGCFWHGHDCKRGARKPKNNEAYWREKIARNVARDAAAIARLTEMGWRALTIWECEIRDEAALAQRLRMFLDGDHASAS